MSDTAKLRSPTQTERRSRVQDVTSLLGILLIALVFRITAIDALPSADELWHLGLSRGLGSPVGIYPADVAVVNAPSITTLDGAAPAWQVWTHMDGVLHPPLYVLTLRLWRELFGSSIAAGHALSIVWSMIAIGFAFAAAKLAMGRTAAVCAASLVAVAPIQVYFAQEIRGYEMMIAIGSIMLWLATRIEVLGPTTRRAALLGSLALPLLLTHYFAAGAALGTAIYSVVRLRGRPRIAYIAATIVAAAIYLAAWCPFAIRQIAALHTGDAFTKVKEVDLVRELRWAISIPARLFLERPWLTRVVGNASGALFGVVVLVAPWYLRRRLPAMLPWACWLCASVVPLVILDVTRSTFLVMFARYTAVASPAVALLVVAILRTIGPRTMMIACAAGVAAMLMARPVDGGLVADAPNFGVISRWLAKEIQPGDAILVVQGSTGEHTTDLTLMTLAHEPGLFPRTVMKVTGPLTPEALHALPDRVWAVMVDIDEARVDRVFRSARRLQSSGVKDAGMCELYDLSTARFTSTEAASQTNVP